MLSSAFCHSDVVSINLNPICWVVWFLQSMSTAYSSPHFAIHHQLFITHFSHSVSRWKCFWLWACCCRCCRCYLSNSILHVNYSVPWIFLIWLVKIYVPCTYRRSLRSTCLLTTDMNTNQRNHLYTEEVLYKCACLLTLCIRRHCLCPYTCRWQNFRLVEFSQPLVPFTHSHTHTVIWPWRNAVLHKLNNVKTNFHQPKTKKGGEQTCRSHSVHKHTQNWFQTRGLYDSLSRVKCLSIS